MDKSYIVDFQGFKGLHNEFILKEIAIFHDGHNHHFIVLPPYDFSLLHTSLKKQARWLFLHHHGLTWNGGFIDFHQVKTFLREKIKVGSVYVKGAEKTLWIKELLNNVNVEVINLEDAYKTCPNFKALKRIHSDGGIMKCVYHEKCCALQNVYLLKKFICASKQM